MPSANHYYFTEDIQLPTKVKEAMQMQACCVCVFLSNQFSDLLAGGSRTKEEGSRFGV